ncbi:MAG: DUF3854 domain-containing protein [Actinobacteria bacterium]|nr:DUF3854 domain-containing protein [Actinomycetota bacterium]
MTSTPWTAADYHPILGSGAGKLASSAVAPLVAYAQGCSTVTEDTLPALLKSYGIDRRSAQGKQVVGSVSSGDSLLMPWTTAADAAAYWASVSMLSQAGALLPVPDFSALQLRPSVPVLVKNKPMKYINLAGAPTVIGVHPSTPSGWLTGTCDDIWVAEGLIKGMSVITAMLLDGGVDPKDLLVRNGEDVHAGRVRLRDMLDGLSEGSRRLVVSIVGVGNWHSHPEWNAISVRDRDVMIALDGDIDTNVEVAKQARQLFAFLEQRNGRPKILRLADLEAYTPKAGVDDLLARGVTLDDIVATATTDLPSTSSVASTSGWRMNEKTLCTEKRVVDEDGSVRWETMYPYVARVLRSLRPRFLTPEEVATGRLTADNMLPAGNSEITVEFEWKQADGTTASYPITGNQNMLFITPDRWMNPPVSAIMPGRPLGPEPGMFPPTHKEFLAAMQAYRAGETIYRPAWEQMGWVPTPDGMPVFVAGRCAAGADGMVSSDIAMCGIDSDDLAGWDDYGFQMPADAAQAKQAMMDVLDIYLPKESADRVWTNTSHAALVLAAALRPVIPVASRVPVYMSGGSGLGKTWTAATIMAFWQGEPATWTDRHLPGSAKDTATATEIAVARTPIWVTDDISPNGADINTQRRMEGMIEDLIRNIHNGASKRRSTRSLGSAHTFTPMSLLILTAEQPSTLPSIRNRTLHIHAERGFLNPSSVPTDRLDEMSTMTSEQSMVTGWAIKYLAQQAVDIGSWRKLIETWRAEIKTSEDIMKKTVDSAGGSKRQLSLVADISIGLVLWQQIASDLKLPVEYLRRLAEAYGSLNRVAQDRIGDNQEAAISAVFVDKLAAVLSSRQAHIRVLGSPEVPIKDNEHGWGDRAGIVNDRLGWSFPGTGEPPRPNGPSIGYIIHDKDVPYILFEKDAAYKAVTRFEPGLAGHQSSAIWQEVHRAGISAVDRWKRKQARSGSLSVVQRVTLHGVTVEGIVIPVKTIMGWDD